MYADVAARLVAGGFAYESFSTPEEVAARRTAAGQDPKLGYDNADRETTPEQAAELRAQGRLPVLRVRMPDRDWRWDDLVRGPIEFANEHVPDFVIVRGNGEPLYTLVNPVDDALMRITHVLRGEDLLSSTPRQLALYEALRAIGVAAGDAHVRAPAVRDGGGQQEAAASATRSRRWTTTARSGSCRRGCSTTWPCSAGRWATTARCSRCAEMAAAFTLDRVSANPARFDIKKAEAINAVHLRALDPADLAERVVAVPAEGRFAGAGADRAAARAAAGQRPRSCRSG